MSALPFVFGACLFLAGYFGEYRPMKKRIQRESTTNRKVESK